MAIDTSTNAATSPRRDDPVSSDGIAASASILPMAMDTSTDAATSPRRDPSASPDVETSAIEKDDSAWPDWFSNGYRPLKEADLGKKWENLLVKYVDLEARSGFASPRGIKHALTSNKRPAEVEWWIGRARKSQPVIEDVPKFAESFWAWWKGLQPMWRDVSQTSGILTSVHQQGDGDWVELQKPGQNGFLTVMSLLCWWGQVSCTEAEMVEWRAAIEDVDWVLAQILGK